MIDGRINPSHFDPPFSQLSTGVIGGDGNVDGGDVDVDVDIDINIDGDPKRYFSVFNIIRSIEN